MKKISKRVLEIFIISVIFALSLKTHTFAIIGYRYVQAVSYGVAILLMVWQWAQYIIPIIIFLVFIVLNRKKINIETTIIFFIICVILAGLLFTIGNVIVNNAGRQKYLQYKANVFEFNGKTEYYYK